MNTAKGNQQRQALNALHHIMGYFDIIAEQRGKSL